VAHGTLVDGGKHVQHQRRSQDIVQEDEMQIKDGFLFLKGTPSQNNSDLHIKI